MSFDFQIESFRKIDASKAVGVDIHIIGPADVEGRQSVPQFPTATGNLVANLIHSTALQFQEPVTVQHFAKRPQVQERLTVQIVEKLKEVLKTDNVACVVDAKHLCVNMRGVRDTKSSTITSRYSGLFNQNDNKSEFLKHISLDSKIDF